MPLDILGSGFQFPFKIGKNDQLALSRYEEKIKESIRIILGTMKGERVMRPDFGCDIHRFSFSVIDSTTLTQIKSAVREALLMWEPRIEVESVQTDTGKLSGNGRIDIHVQYKIRYTSTPANIVYPFYLETQGAAK